MAVIKNDKTGCWEVRTYYKDINGERKQKTKRGFKKKSDAQKWEQDFKNKEDLDLSMKFKDFVEIYLNDIKPRIKLTTWFTKKSIIDNKILDYFAKMPMNEIKRTDIINWQNILLKHKDFNGKGYSKQYLRTIHNQLSAILNHAVNLYGLRDNAARKAGSIGSKTENLKETLIWTPAEYMKFAEAISDKAISYYAFEILYNCGLRVGELLALTQEDFNFEKKTLRINKNFQHIDGKDIITTPKTPQSNRIIILSEFIVEEIKTYFDMLYENKPDDRIFPISKAYLHHELDRGAKLANVKRLTIHQLRHSHISNLIHLGYTAVEIGKRVGHSAQEITFRYAHEFPTIQSDMAQTLDNERRSLINVSEEQR